MKKDDFYNISVLGRVAYAIMCFERYVTSKYPNTDFRAAAEMMWSIVDGSNYLDESSYRYIEIVPECLFEADSYNNSDFEYLTEAEYDNFTSMLNSNDKNLNTLMQSIYDSAMSYAYRVPEPGAPKNIPILKEIDTILSRNGIDLPDKSVLSKYTPTDSDGLGDYFDGRYLSIILNQN